MRPRLAVLLTSYGETSHGVCICTKLLESGRCEVAAIHLMEVADDDVGVATAERHGVPLFHSVAAALCLGGDSLAVDGVVVVGEHGTWPRNDKGQKLYPRRELFDQVVAVFRRAGRVVPVFNDKHLSWNRTWAMGMWADVCSLGIPFMAGSSLPYAEFSGAVDEVPADCLVATGFGPLECYGFHALETAQSVAERRAGGESGLRSVRCLSGAEVWRAVEARWPGDVVDAVVGVGWELVRLPHPGDEVHAFELDHLDGFRTLVLMAGAVERSFAFGHAAGVGAYHLDPLPRVRHFSTFVAAMEDMFLTGTPPCPPERTVLTTVALACLMDSRAGGGVEVRSPDLAIAYAG